MSSCSAHHENDAEACVVKKKVFPNFIFSDE